MSFQGDSGAPSLEWTGYGTGTPEERAVYPIVHQLTHANAREMRVDWYDAICRGLGQITPYHFDGNVWTIQLTARPGYYVAPEIQQAMGWMDQPADPTGMGGYAGGY